LSHINSEWDWRDLSMNPGISIQDIQNHQDLPWSYGFTCQRKNLTIDEIRIINTILLDDNDALRRICQYEISKNISLNLDTILENPDIQWDIGGLSANTNITFKEVLDHIDLAWVWRDVSKYVGLTIQDVLRNSKLPVDILTLADDPSTPHHIKLMYARLDDKHKQRLREENLNRPRTLPLDVFFLAENPNISFQDMIDTPQLKWSYSKLLEKLRHATFVEAVDNHTYRPDWSYLSEHLKYYN
jgi:hypothetical protein